MIKEWNVYEPVPNLDSFAARISASPIVASVLWHRGIRTKKDAMDFLYPERVSFGDPFLMRDMDLAVSRIIEAIDRRERIVVYGDYDVDGISATAVLLHNLRKLGANADFYIPNRMTEGYGLNRNALEMLAPNSDLLISVDCGIASVKDVEAMKEKLDIIITAAAPSPLADGCRVPCGRDVEPIDAGAARSAFRVEPQQRHYRHAERAAQGSHDAAEARSASRGRGKRAGTCEKDLAPRFWKEEGKAG